MTDLPLSPGPSHDLEHDLFKRADAAMAENARLRTASRKSLREASQSGARLNDTVRRMHQAFMPGFSRAATRSLAHPVGGPDTNL